MINLRYIILLSLVSSLLGTGCAKWLDVSPNTQQRRETIYQKVDGFNSVLTGVYNIIADRNLYGEKLTWKYISELELRYSVPPKEEASLPDRFNYDNDASRDEQEAIFKKAYYGIANINDLLDALDEYGQAVIQDVKTRDYIRGEALGLRALLHFDLLRLWGPIYDQDPTYKSIPYRTTLSPKKLDLLPAEDVLDSIMVDLKSAEKLLANDDIQWVNNPSPRSFRMNLYAVKALLARVALWKGEVATAYQYANDVILHSGITLSSSWDHDPTLSRETLFSPNVYELSKKTEYYFPPIRRNITASSNVLKYINLSDAEELFETNLFGGNDIRFKDGFGFLHNGTLLVSRKMMGNSLMDAPYRADRIPILRLAEMYLIRAETGTLPEAVADLNTLRKARGIGSSHLLVMDDNFNEEQRRHYLDKEYEKEFFTEGQWWYYLKRNYKKEFFRLPPQVKISKAVYTFPMVRPEVLHGLGQRDEY